jgi:hypothetical protein
MAARAHSLRERAALPFQRARPAAGGGRQPGQYLDNGQNYDNPFNHLALFHATLRFARMPASIAPCGKTTGRQVEQSTVDKSIARLNIEHYRKLLASETDEAKRQ